MNLWSVGLVGRAHTGRRWGVGLVGRAHIGRRWGVSQSKGLEVVWKDEVSCFQDAPAPLGLAGDHSPLSLSSHPVPAPEAGSVCKDMAVHTLTYHPQQLG